MCGIVGLLVKNPALRERLLLDFDWRFHFGHANDPAKDFGFSNGRSREAV